ncbi:hypothetical protein IEQ34_018639 [Dendrobium chrysotoxum]|uniref:Uncharacterized protein n=1 Tax=Dendrobium chrysotoxum TaxID=161865 RepID=A0AAV7G6C7_DENCH|nr:hypothetical protein IEQ34_018639 [Dendrobium chrysotoxum]
MLHSSSRSYGHMRRRSKGDMQTSKKGVYKNEKEAYNVYYSYAHNNGFSVRMDQRSYWPNFRKINCIQAYSHDGVRMRKRHTTFTVVMPIVLLLAKFQKDKVQGLCTFKIRTGCSIMIRFIVDKDRNWNVKKKIKVTIMIWLGQKTNIY